MIVVLKIFFACFVGMAWYHLNGSDQAPIAVILFVMILLASFIKPISYQDPKERDEYRHKIQEAREKREMLIQNPEYVNSILREGAIKARKIAQEKITLAKKVVGLLGNSYKYL